MQDRVRQDKARPLSPPPPRRCQAWNLHIPGMFKSLETSIAPSFVDLHRSVMNDTLQLLKVRRCQKSSNRVIAKTQ